MGCYATFDKRQLSKVRGAAVGSSAILKPGEKRDTNDGKLNVKTTSKPLSIICEQQRREFLQGGTRITFQSEGFKVSRL